MYKAKLWDEDKWNIHSESYGSSKYASNAPSDKKEDKEYHKQKYGSEGKNLSSDYMKNEGQTEEDKKDENILGDLEGEKKENKEISEEEIPFRAAKQIFEEHKPEQKKEGHKKNIKTIDEAIKKAIEEEKKVIVMD